MTYRLQILSEAADDIKEVTIWYRDLSPELGLRFVSELYYGFDSIVANPNAWFKITSRGDDMHFLFSLLNHFPGTKRFNYCLCGYS